MNAQALNQLEKKFGPAVEFDGKKYWLTQDAYLSGQIESPYYEAAGVDEVGRDYEIYWDILPEVDINNLEDQGDACDWDNPSEVRKI